MPIFDQGYQHWNGKLSGHASRWLTIARHGVRSQMKNRATRLVLLGGLAPVLALVGFLVFWGLLEQRSPLIGPLAGILDLFPEQVRADPSKYRIMVWTIAYQFFFDVEIILTMILVMTVGPSLISQDLRFNAMPLYFSRPLRRFDYFAGKLGVIAFFLAGIAIVPSVLAYLLGLGFSLDLKVIRDTGRLLLASVAFGAIVVLSAGTLMLAISSLTKNSRYVTAIWIGVWVLTAALGAHLMLALKNTEWVLVAYSENLDNVGGALIDNRSAWETLFSLVPSNGPMPRRDFEEQVIERSGAFAPWYWSAAILVGLFGLSLWILSTRVKSMDRLK